MAFKLVVLAACLAAANAGVLAPAPVAYAAAPAAYGYAAPAVSSVSQNTLRSFGNTAQVSTYSKALDTPFSSVRKTDVRISNPGVATYGYAAPAAYAAPIAHAAPVAVAAPAVARLGVAYSAAPVVASMTFSGYGINYAY